MQPGHDAETTPAGVFLDLQQPIVEKRDVSAEFVDEVARYHSPVILGQNEMRAGDRSDDAATVDVANQDHRYVGAGGKTHICDVARPEVDLGRRTSAFDDDEVDALADLLPGIEHGLHQFRLEQLVVACLRLTEHLTLHDDLTADVALRFQEHRVHMDGGRDTACDRLQPLRPTDLAATGLARDIGDGGVVRHVLRLEGTYA